MNSMWIVLIAGGLFSSLVTCQSQSKYSLSNMPHTGFTCRDKILGGYYADPETNCQMFHICVKVAGVGIQDFRFLCPQGTAFDQEAQICADWGDVDCDAAKLYYSGSNFDLYRIGSNFESTKRGSSSSSSNNNYAEEDESVFHLQRAETSDARRSKQYVVNQNSIQSNSRPTSASTTTTTSTTTRRPTPFTTSTTTTTIAPVRHSQYETTRIPISTYKPTLNPKKVIDDKAIVSTYRPNNDFYGKARAAAAVQDDGEIFKQSQSSHFFNNKNNGKEDFDDDYVKATKAPVVKQKVRGRHRGRSKYRNPNAVTSAPARTPIAATPKAIIEQNTRTSFTNTPIVVHPVNNQQRPNVTTLQAATSYQAQQSRQFISQPSTAAPAQKIDENFFDVPKIKQKVQTTKLKSAQAPITSSSSPAPPPPPPIPPQIPNLNSFPQNFFGAIPQRVIIPSQLSPEQRLALQASNGKSLTTSSTVQTTSTTTPVTPQQLNRLNQVSEQQKSFVSPQKFNFKTQKYEFIEPQNPTTQFYNTKYETNGQLNLEPTKSNFVKTNNKTYAQRQTTTGQDESKPTTFNPQQYYQSNEYQNLSPRGFSLAAQQQAKKTPEPEIRPQITSRAEPRNHKKFSTLVPKDQYNQPTTFKPSTYNKKPVPDVKYEKSPNPSKYYTAIVTTSPPPPAQIAAQSTQLPQQIYHSVYQTTQLPQQNFNNIYQTTTTRNPSFYSTSSTPPPLGADEEDDGQYRPHLYEKDLYKNKAKTTTVIGGTTKPIQNALFTFYQTSTTSLPVVQQQNNFQQQQKFQSNNFEEDELFKTAHSQNIFASGNQLRAEKEKEKLVVKNFEQYTEKSSPRPFSKPTLPPTTTPLPTPKATSSPTKKGKVVKDKDVSYDYQYYDTNGDSADYPEIEQIEDFGRTSVKKSST